MNRTHVYVPLWLALFVLPFTAFWQFLRLGWAICVITWRVVVWQVKAVRCAYGYLSGRSAHQLRQSR